MSIDLPIFSGFARVELEKYRKLLMRNLLTSFRYPLRTNRYHLTSFRYPLRTNRYHLTNFQYPLETKQYHLTSFQYLLDFGGNSCLKSRTERFRILV